MNISSLYGSLGTTATSNVASVGQPSASQSSAPPGLAGAATTSISAQGQFFSEMQQLSQTNPTEFKAVATQVAASFQSAASQATGQQAQFLSNLASTFSQAAQTGSLQPSQGTQSASAGQASQATQGSAAGQASIPAGKPGGASGAHHHHHHHGGGGSTLQSSSVQQAFASAMSILTQATQGTSTSTAATSV